MPIALHVLSESGRDDFVAALSDIFEHAPWVAESVYSRRPFVAVTALHEAMLAALAAASSEAVIGFLNNHPDLAGPSARAQGLTAASAQEQAIAGLDTLTQEDAARLALWNARYRERFGFPFIICVRRHTHVSIFAEFERRLAADRLTEQKAALAKIARNTALRLTDRVAGPGMPKVHGRLSTHLLDTASGCSAAGVAVRLFLLTREGPARLVAEAVSDADGRTPQPLISARPVPIGTYELRFSIGDYLARQSDPVRQSFLDIAPVRFSVGEPEAHYHIPLLFKPWSYAAYRGS